MHSGTIRNWVVKGREGITAVTQRSVTDGKLSTSLIMADSFMFHKQKSADNNQWSESHSDSTGY